MIRTSGNGLLSIEKYLRKFNVDLSKLVIITVDSAAVMVSVNFMLIKNLTTVEMFHRGAEIKIVHCIVH